MNRALREDWLAFYAARGIATIPLRPREKRPLRADWLTPSASTWAGAPDDANIGVLCGAASGGLVVFDYDTPDGLHEATGMRASELAVHTLVARTARGHHVYAYAPGFPHGKHAGILVRSDGGMVVAPPSAHPSGARYEFLHASSTIAMLSSLPLDIEAAASSNPPEEPVDWERIEAWIALQSPKLQASWKQLRDPVMGFDRSRADFAVAICLWEAGHDEAFVARVLLSLPGSKARERGERYARLTASRAARIQNRRGA